MIFLTFSCFRYLERAHKEGKDVTEESMNSDEVGEDDISKARNAFQTGLGTVDKLRDARCTWTLKGWRETLKDGTQVMRAEKMTEEELEAEAEADAHKSKVKVNFITQQ